MLLGSGGAAGGGLASGGRCFERTMRTVLVVMRDVRAHDLLQLAPTEDQNPVEAFASQASHPALGVCLRSWCPHRRSDHADTVGAEHIVEAARELVAVTHEEAHQLL